VTPYFVKDGIELYCGDCRKIIPQLNLSEVSLVLTDPPYPEDKRFEGTHELIHEVAELIWRLVPEDCWLVSDLFRPRLEDWLVSWRPWIYYDMLACFVKNSMAKCALGVDRLTPSLLFKKGKPKVYKKWSNVITTVRQAGGRGWTGHPSQKSLEGYQKFVAMLAGEGVTFDPFVGSGTTLVAAMFLGRRAVGIELSEKYCKRIVKRIEQRNHVGTNLRPGFPGLKLDLGENE